MNVFSTPEFLETAADVFFPGQPRSIEVFRIDGRLLRLLVINGRVVERMPFYDFPQPLEGWTSAAKDRWFFPRTVLKTTTVAERVEPEPPGLQPSPYIDWSLFADEQAFQAHVAASPTLKSNDPARQRRKLERDVGPIEFRWHDERPEVFDRCVRWKSAQYNETGVPDTFAPRANVELFRRLIAQGLVKVASLSAKGTLLAAHFGSHTDKRFTWWVPAYDPSSSKYSPGRLLLLELMRESQARGDVEFDFLIGDENYKFLFATHNRVIGPVGAPPAGWLVERLLRRNTKAVLERHPKALQLGRTIKRTLGQ